MLPCIQKLKQNCDIYTVSGYIANKDYAVQASQVNPENLQDRYIYPTRGKQAQSVTWNLECLISAFVNHSFALLE